MFLRKVQIVEFVPPGKANIGTQRPPSSRRSYQAPFPFPAFKNSSRAPGDAIFEPNVIYVGCERTTRPTAEVLIKSYRNLLAGEAEPFLGFLDAIK